MLALTPVHPIPLYGADFRPPDTPIDHFANGELVVGAVLIIAFTVLYGTRFRWWRSAPTTLEPKGAINFAGIAIFTVFLALSSLLVYSLFVRVLTPGDYFLRDVFRAAVYFLLPASGTFLIVALFASREQLLRALNAQERHSPPETPAEFGRR